MWIQKHMYYRSINTRVAIYLASYLIGFYFEFPSNHEKLVSYIFGINTYYIYEAIATMVS